MEVSNSHGGVRRSRDSEVTSSGNGKRRKFGAQDREDVFQLEYQSRRDRDVNLQENIVSTAVSGTSDHASPFMCFRNDDSRPDLKSQAECISETEVFMSSNDGFSEETSVSSVVCLESEEMESVSTSTPKKKNPAPPNEATSRRKPSATAKIPSAAELEEFFSEAEKYEKKRFAEKYNYDIVKDAPMEGRYQWVRLKP
ncbi:cyclin-dependent kinase inhibitor 7-like [Cynara cardunculus var. scolymus]|uniref:Cyclin-dependent kinase inhibitor n=1 Tax=Cynara cardunculus var. scolymus TaxID=59895 RepID=A0A103YKD7_CYNCS|nr:cyclin-dependent kinase inhibitor 7-like [Cynara cardunculus var. scolymus]KVI10761.1 Cyclin-dependent kinase inhibitor [Cynara cardunculus var. scolymus]